MINKLVSTFGSKLLQANASKASRSTYINALNTDQGRNWLPKTGWASSNVARRLLFCQKLGGQMPTLLTRQVRPC